jgi:hypothetical protein
MIFLKFEQHAVAILCTHGKSGGVSSGGVIPHEFI